MTLELYSMVTLPEILRNYAKNSKGLAFYKSLYNFFNMPGDPL